MNVVIDQGNSFYKIGVFDGDILLFSSSGSDVASLISRMHLDFPDVKHGIISSVGATEQYESILENSTIKWLRFSTETPTPLRNKYHSPKTLGLDRLAAGVGASVLFPNQNSLIIDAGTAITYEYISAEGEYLGGNISPGLHMRYKSLHTFTEKLPLLEPGAPLMDYGLDTASAIRLGVENGILYEINGTIDDFRSRIDKGAVLITGGDALFFEKKLKSRIFAQPNLVLIGLNNILIYTIENTLF